MDTWGAKFDGDASQALFGRQSEVCEMTTQQNYEIVTAEWRVAESDGNFRPLPLDHRGLLRMPPENSPLVTAEITFTDGKQAAAMYELHNQDQRLEIRLELEGVDESQVVSGLTQVHPPFSGDESQTIHVNDSIRNLTLSEPLTQ